SSRACASSCSTSRMDALASFKRSRGVATSTSGSCRPQSGGTEPLNTTSGVNIPRLDEHARRGADGPGPGDSAPGGRLRGHGAAAMELGDALRRRTMVRSFAAAPVDPDLVRRILDGALRAPTAGNTGGTSWLALMGPEQTSTYWTATTDEAWRSRNPERAEGLRRAPVVLLSY